MGHIPHSGRLLVEHFSFCRWVMCMFVAIHKKRPEGIHHLFLLSSDYGWIQQEGGLLQDRRRASPQTKLSVWPWTFQLHKCQNINVVLFPSAWSIVLGSDAKGLLQASEHLKPLLSPSSQEPLSKRYCACMTTAENWVSRNGNWGDSQKSKTGMKMWGVHLRTPGRKDKGTLLYSAWLSAAELVWNERWLGNWIMEPHFCKQRWHKTLWFHPSLGYFALGWNPSAI